MQNTIVIWKSIDCDPQNSMNLEKRLLVIMPRESKNDRLIRGLTSIEKNMGIDQLEQGERLPIKISKDKKGLIIRDKNFIYMFYGSKSVLAHKERIMNKVLVKISENFTKKGRELTNGSVSKKTVKDLYGEVQEVYQSKHLHFISL
jgi:hypothetical protein